jgi:hypothetical protein
MQAVHQRGRSPDGFQGLQLNSVHFC